MVSYYNSLAMFPHQTSRSTAPPASNPASLYHGYHAPYNNYPPPDQNSNLQLYGMSPQFDFSQTGVTPSSWPSHAPWGTHFPAPCRTYEWENPTTTLPPSQSPEVTPTSDSTLTTSPSSPPYNEGGNRSPAHSFQGTPSNYNRAFTPPQYKLEPPSSTSELPLPNGSLGSDMNEECPSPSSLPPSRPGPARSPYEWMKKPAYQSPSSLNDPNARTRTKDKYRVVYSDHQRLELEKEFHYSRYITIRRKAELANGIGLSERQVKIWFQNRRAKERRSMKKQDDVIGKDKMDPLGAFSSPNMSMGEFAPSSLGMPHFPYPLPQTFPPFMKYE